VISLELPVPPSANRWWRNVNGRTIKSKEARAYLNRLRVRADGFYYAGDVCVQIVWYRKDRRGDLDKRIPIILDVLQGITYVNDKQVWALEARREEDKANPRVEVVVMSKAEWEGKALGSPLDHAEHDPTEDSGRAEMVDEGVCSGLSQAVTG